MAQTFLNEPRFPLKVDISSEHRCNARNLLLLVHEIISRGVGLEVEGHLPCHPGQDGQQVPSLRLPGQDMAQRLYEPRPRRRVPPRVEAGDGRVGDQEVGVRRDLVAERGRVGLVVAHLPQVHAGVQLVALTGLDEEELGLAGQGAAALGVEVVPQALGLVGVVRGVQGVELAVTEHGDEDAVGVGVVLHAGLLQQALDLLVAEVVVDPHLKVQGQEGGPEVVPVGVGAVPLLEAEARIEVHVVEDEGNAAAAVVHVVGLSVLLDGHAGHVGVGAPGPVEAPGVALVRRSCIQSILQSSNLEAVPATLRTSIGDILIGVSGSHLIHHLHGNQSA